MTKGPKATKKEKLATVDAPFPYFGGKRKIAQQVWRRLGNPTTYVEPFAGSMAVLLARPHDHEWWAKRETVNDASGHVINFYRAVAADPEAVARYANWPVSELDLTARHLELVNRQELLATELGNDPKFYDPELAGWWIWGISAWVGGEWCSGLGPWRREPGGPGVYRKMPMSSASHGGKGVHRTLSGHPARWISSNVPDLDAEIFEEMHQSFEAISQRLRRVRILCGDWKRTTKSVVKPSGKDITGIFIDPPYALSDRRANLYGPTDSRKKGGRFEQKVEESRDIHLESRTWALSLTDETQYRIAYCTYQSDSENALFIDAGWTGLPWTAAGGYGLQSDRRARDNRQREIVWFSPSCLPDTEQEPKKRGESRATSGLAISGEDS